MYVGEGRVMYAAMRRAESWLADKPNRLELIGFMVGLAIVRALGF